MTIQLLKIRQTENFIDAFFKKWQEKGFSVLLQKQNTYLGQVPDYRFSDLSPLTRFPCWHLKRDLVIWSDGSVPFCKQDIFGNKLLGQLTENNPNQPDNEKFAAIWQKGAPFAVQQAKMETKIETKLEAKIEPKQDLQDFPDCASCDEWYTFNH